MLWIPNIPIQIPDTQWKICEKFNELFCFPKQTIRSHCLHKALGIALMRASGGGSCALKTLYQKFIKNHAFIYTAVKSDKNSLNPLRASVSSMCNAVVVRRTSKGGELRKSLGGWKMCNFPFRNFLRPTYSNVATFLALTFILSQPFSS